MQNSTEPESGNKTLPPGPSGLPCIGSILEYKGPKTNLAWTKQYGPIYYVKLGSKNLVYLNSLELVQNYLEGKKGELFLDRPMGPGAIAEGLLFGSGDNWRKNKRAFMKAMHTETFIEDLESVIQAEIGFLISRLRVVCGDTISIGDMLLPACVNTVGGLLIGGSLSQDSAERRELIQVGKNLEGCNLSSMLTQIALKLPFLRDPLSKMFFREIVDVHGTSRILQKLFRKWIRQCRSGTFPQLHQCQQSQSRHDSILHSIFHNDKQTCLEKYSEKTDIRSENESVVNLAFHSAAQFAFLGFPEIGHGEQPYDNAETSDEEEGCPTTPLTEYQWTFSNQMSTNEHQLSILHRILQQPEFCNMTEENDSELLQSLIDMFFGGVTSTLSATEFLFMYLSKHRDKQRKAQEEIDQVIEANGGQLRWSLRDRMPYVQACITEALRLGAVTPSSLPHVATQDTEIEGYAIPKGTFVMGSIISLHYDPNFYLEPEEFMPQRHLDINGGVRTPESFRPYGIGARRCVGDTIASMEMFMYTVAVLKNFDVADVDERRTSDMETHMRIIHRLKNFQCILTSRN